MLIGSYFPWLKKKERKKKTTEKQYQEVQLELVHHHTTFRSIQLKSVSENYTNRFHFALTLWPLVKVKATGSQECLDAQQVWKNSAENFLSNAQH